MQYFKHHSNMRNDVKIRRLISRYGLEGYGLYCLIVESITETLSTASPTPDLQETCEDIADFYNSNTSKVNEMANFMINQGLLDIDEISGHILCSKIYKFLEASQTRSSEVRAMINQYKSAGKKNVSRSVTDNYERKEEKRKEEELEKKRKEEDIPISDRYEKNRLFWNQKANPECKTLFPNLQRFMIEDIMKVFKTYSDDEIQKAIINYSESKTETPYASFFNFLKNGGIEKYQNKTNKVDQYNMGQVDDF